MSVVLLVSPQEQYLKDLGCFRELAALKATTDPYNAARLLYRYGTHDSEQDEALQLLCSLRSCASWPGGFVPILAWDLMQLCIQRHASGAVERGRSSILATMEVQTAVYVMRGGWEGLEDAPRARYLGSAQLALARMHFLCKPEVSVEEQQKGGEVVEGAEVCWQVVA